MRTPWEQRSTAIAGGLDPASLTERAARRRVGDAGLGRTVVVPAYLRRRWATAEDVSQVGLLVRLPPGGGVSVDRNLLPPDLGDQSRFWRAVQRSADSSEAVVTREGWTRVVVRAEDGSSETIGSLILRDGDWGLVRESFRVRDRLPTEPQDAPVEHVTARFLGRLDGLDGTTSAGLWGRLALEVVTVRQPERLADTRSLRWYASWGQGGFPAGSGGRATGSAGHEMLLELTQQQVGVLGRLFRVRTLPDWEREEAAHDLGLPAGRLMAWPVTSLSAILALFEDISPAPLAAGSPQDTVRRRIPGPQDTR